MAAQVDVDPCGPDHLAVLSPQTAPLGARFGRALFDLVEHIGPWMLVGIIVAGYVHALVPDHALEGVPLMLQLLIVTAVAIPSHVRASSAVPLAAVLVMKGLSPGAAMVGLLLGPATNLGTVRFLRQRFGARATTVALGGVVAFVWVLALVMDVGLAPSGHGLGALLDVDAHGHGQAHGHDHGGSDWVGLGALWAVGALVVGSFWRSGVGAWLEALHGHHDHGHPHTHAHDALDELVAGRNR